MHSGEVDGLPDITEGGFPNLTSEHVVRLDIMKIIVDCLEYSANKAAIMAEFDKPLSKLEVKGLKVDGFSGARVLTSSCMQWIWLQWLLGGSENHIKEKVRLFVDKGMEMQGSSSLLHMRAHADLYLLHCAIFGSNQSQMEAVAARLVDASALGKYHPKNDGELYLSAWCGMLKHWILGNEAEAIQQSELIWGAYRDPSSSAASKTLVTPWLKGDWNGFLKAQEKDFEKLWNRGRKDGTVRSEKREEVAVTVQRFPVEQKWCWAHAGLALLAHRRHGVDISTDPFWLPAAALRCC